MYICTHNTKIVGYVITELLLMLLQSYCLCYYIGLEKKAKKRVSFASDDALTEIFYFEMDESERCK